MYKIVTVPIRLLEEHPDNYALHGPFDAQGKDRELCQDVAENGVLVPILIDQDNTILKGHRRVYAASLAGATEIVAVRKQCSESENFPSYKIQRNYSIYAKAVLLYTRVHELLADSASEEEWFRFEQLSGEKRHTMLTAVGLLDQCFDLANSSFSEVVERSHRLDQTFRDRGIMPAVRMIGLETHDLDHVEPDCADYQGGAAEEIEEPHVRHAERPERWIEDAYRLLAGIEKHLREHGVYDDQCKCALDLLELVLDDQRAVPHESA